MISFHKAEAADRAWAHEILKNCAYPGAEYAFSCMYLWSDYFGELGRAGERLTQHAPWRGREVYLYPAGTGDLREAIEAIRADAAERGNPLRLRSLTNETRAELEALYPGKFEFTACRNSYDYIYTVEELTELRGKKLQSKRNHCHRFESEHPDWHTEVITAVEVSGGQSDPDDPVTVQFHIDGTTYTVSNVYYPDGDSQLAWVRWTTPDEPQDMTIDVDVSGPGSAQATIHCKIVDLDENPPPNPVADDRNDSFTPSPVPDRPEKTSAQWTIWDPWWQEYWVWHGDDEDGYWCDHGWWEFDLDRYSASLSAAMEITPDEKNPTASDSTMKSGYGVNQVVTARVNSSQRSATTALQNAVSYFPEFNYESFWRLLDRISISSSSSRLEFQKNEYSTYNRRTHFTPIWYPDGSYTVNTWVIDCWTPAGMLSVNLTDSLNIRGNLWDDWHIAPLDL